MTEGEENLRKIYSEATGDLEMVLEKRMNQSRTQKREGYFVIEVGFHGDIVGEFPHILTSVSCSSPKAIPERLLEHLLEETVDDNYHIDFLLTYRTFLPSPEPILEKLLKAWNERVDLRKRVSLTFLPTLLIQFKDCLHGNGTDVTDLIDLILFFTMTISVYVIRYVPASHWSADVCVCVWGGGGDIHLLASIQRPQFLGLSSGLYGQVPLYVLSGVVGCVMCVLFSLCR